MPAEIQKCPKCGQSEIDIESVGYGGDYPTEDYFYQFCIECEWESDVRFPTWEAADEDRRANIKECARQLPTTAKG